VWFGGGTYVLDLESGAWTQWNSPTSEFAWGLLVPREQNALTPDTMIGVTGITTVGFNGLYKAVDAYLGVNTEEIACVMETNLLI